MKKMHPIVWAILCLPVVYFAMVTASVYIPGENVFALLERFSTMVRRPDLLRWTAYTPRFLLVFLLLYGGGVLLYYADHENRRPGEEYGSAKWGNARELNKRYADQNGKNVILTKRVSIGLDGYKHRRNLNILVVGGSGSGKTRFFCKPGIMSVNCSYLIIDPKGEMLRSTGYLLKDEGYDIKVFDLIHPRQSDGYNPFTYIRDDPDVLKLMDNLVKNTTPPKGASNDPFWEKAEIALDSALMLYLLYEAPVEEQNFEMLMFMLECARVMEEDEQYQSPLDLLFQTLEERAPSHIAVREYKVYKQAAGKTAKSILVTASVRLAAFIFPQYAAMMQTDEMDFASMGERKRAIFCVMDNNWIIDNLNYAFGVWNDKLTEMWSLLTQSPQAFKGGTIWQTIQTVNGAMQGIGYGLLVLFLAIGIFRSSASFRDFQRPEHVLRHFIYFVMAKLAVTYGIDLMVDIFAVCAGIISAAAGSVGGIDGAAVSLPAEIAAAIEDVGFLASIPLWLVTLLGCLLITVLAFLMILTVYGRFFKLYLYAALSPVALAS